MKSKAAQALGKKGGQKTKQKYGKDHFKKMGLLGAEKRWKKSASSKEDKPLAK